MTFRLGGAATDDEECLEATVATDGGQVVGQQQWLIGRVDPGTRPLRTARDEDDHDRARGFSVSEGGITTVGKGILVPPNEW